MCNVFSGHIGCGKDNWGKIYFNSGIFLEEDFGRIYPQKVISWKTKIAWEQ